MLQMIEKSLKDLQISLEQKRISWENTKSWSLVFLKFKVIIASFHSIAIWFKRRCSVKKESQQANWLSNTVLAITKWAKWFFSFGRNWSSVRKRGKPNTIKSTFRHWMTFCFKKTFLAGLLQPDMQNLEVRTNKVAEFGHLVCCDRNRWFKLPYHCWI